MKIYNINKAKEIVDNQDISLMHKFLIKKTIESGNFVFKKSKLESIFLDLGFKKRQISNELKIINDKNIFIKKQNRRVDYDTFEVFISLMLSDSYIDNMNNRIEFETKFI